MSLVAKANALKAELGLPPDMPAAAAISAAREIMQIIPEQGESLPHLVDRVVAAVGCVVAPAPAAAPAPALAPPAAAAPAPAAARAPAAAAPTAASTASTTPTRTTPPPCRRRHPPASASRRRRRRRSSSPSARKRQWRTRWSAAPSSTTGPLWAGQLPLLKPHSRTHTHT